MSPPRDPKDVRVLVAMTCYGSADLAVDCLRSLALERREAPGLQVGVCENGTGEHSTRRLLDAIQREGWSDWVYMHEIVPNRGFAGGTNVVLRDGLAWPDPPDYFWLLNTDTLIQPGATKRLLAALEADASLGILTPQLIDADATPQTSVFRHHSPLTEFLRAAGTGMLNRLFQRAPFPLELASQGAAAQWASFAAAMLRRETLVQVGLLDEGYYLYFDDCDYGWRTRRAGWRIGICPEACVVHLEGGSNDAPEASRAGRRRAPYYYASRARYFAKLYGKSGLWLANVAFMAGRAVAVARRWLPGKPPPRACISETRDNWTHCWAPLRRRTAPASDCGAAVDRIVGAMPACPAGTVSPVAECGYPDTNAGVPDHRAPDRT
jgi:N-acetylglucosaminyl-diphospho-decaprenol L-rhamnosyltransferase